MQRIVLIAPNDEIAVGAKRMQRTYQLKMDVCVGMMQEGVVIAKQCLQRENPPQVFLSRGGTALLLRSELRIPVAEIKIALPDAVKALEEASQYGRKIMFLGFSNHIQSVKSLNSLIDLDIQEVVLEDWENAEDILTQAKNDGYDAVIGGALQQKVASKVGIPFVFLDSGEAAIYNGYMQAQVLLDVLREEERKTQEIRTILDDTRDGFIAIDKTSRITLINKSATTMIGISSEQILGKKLSLAIPAIARLSKALSGVHDKDDIISIGNNKFLIQQTPLKHRQEVIGAMATLKSVSAVKSDESRIRYQQYQDGLYANYRFQDIVGSSPALIATKNLAERYAKVDSTILIVSESGTGKEMFAQSIHNASFRSEGPFVAINCASLSASILESELFGYVDGAFTGAKKGGKAGVFEMANNGTIFLDEIGELPLDIQGKLLRVLQERCIMRLGATRIIPVDVRVIAATNRNLVEDVGKRMFRQDLFFRLDVLRLSIPPLRDRCEDIAELCKLFLKRYGGEHPPTLERKTLEAFRDYSWPGNIRELENIIERLCICDAREAHDIVLRHFADMQQLLADPPLQKIVLNEATVREALKKSKGNKKKAAESLGVHRSTLYRFLNDHNQV